MKMPKVVTSTELQKNTRTVIDWVRTRGDTVIVETYGKPMVAILTVDEYEDYLRYQEKQQRFRPEMERLRG
jgi:PHD/YefM family antitoxin component YafN of YafNO toxin-antitoxin module